MLSIVAPAVVGIMRVTIRRHYVISEIVTIKRDGARRDYAKNRVIAASSENLNIGAQVLFFNAL